MKRSIGYTLSLPDGYAEGDQRYPVIYFLHGYGGDETSDGAGISKIAKALASRENAPAAICVFPNGGKSAYRDNPESGVMVETMICEELIPHIDQTYRTLSHRNSRAIAGFSMGGNGAVRLALIHPELFGAAASWAGSMMHPWDSRELPSEVSAALQDTSLPRVQLLLITGYEDTRAFEGEQVFLQALNAAHYPYRYRTLPGVDHNLGLYYQHSGDDFVRFLLHQLASE